ncbi:MAG: PIG-L family deacetylase [Planctomycetota bacterium]|jgi:LmbE family N-acetylglucosaminyl deacetylase|nr:PIG-L family deacetylase [Planctomycetota bacterium]
MAGEKKAKVEAQANPQCVMAIAAHPDDIEFAMAGTLLALREMGWEVHYFNISNGDVGSMTLSRAGTAKVRLSEARASCERAGFIHHRPIVGDLGIAYENRQLARVTAAIRKARPGVILTQSLDDYAEDHESAARLACGAAFCKSMKNSPCVPAVKPYFADVAVYHAMPHGLRDGMGKRIRSGLWVDIGDHIDAKKELLACHHSQKQWLDATQGMDSYLQTMVDLCRAMGEMSGKFAFAEGWRKHNLLGYAADPSWDPLRDALGDRALTDRKYAAWLER